MSLKQSIIIKNEFSAPDGSERGGSRGGTPGNYVVSYMSRRSATEPIAPVARNRIDDFVSKYMARASAVEQVLEGYQEGLAVPNGRTGTHGYSAPTLAARRRERSVRRLASRAARRAKSWVSTRAFTKSGKRGEPVPEVGRAALEEAFAKSVGYGGAAFGHNGVSLSDEQLRADSANLQELFDGGRVVLKTVLSFEHDYLVQMGCVPEGMDLRSDGRPARGGYRGNLDQLKLRLAIMEGLAQMERVGSFGSLRYVGVIQVDTSNVHCHLAMVDTGEGRPAVDGRQRGKLSAREMALLRRGVDASLSKNLAVRHLASGVNHQRRSVSAYIRGWAHRSLSVSAQAQFVLACLPEDRRLWRASTNRVEMAKPNRLVRELVEEHLAEPGSPMPTAMAQVLEYASTRMLREGLTQAEHDRLVADGRERIVRQAMNGVYAVLATVADDEFTTSTALLSTMSMDFEELLGHHRRLDPARDENAELGRFAMRLRSFSERCDRHRRLRTENLLKARSWEVAAERGQAAPGSEAMYRHYLTEADYHGKVLSKYQHYLDLATASMDGWDAQWARAEAYGRRLAGLRALRADGSIAKMKDPGAAEALGKSLYGQSGGALLAATGAQGRAGRAMIDDRLERMTTRYERMVADLLESWRAKGPAVSVRALAPGESPETGERLISAGDREVYRRAGSDRTSQASEADSGAVATDLRRPGVAVVAHASPEHDFELVKGLDMHELGLDWGTDQEVGPRTAERFVEMSRRRVESIVEARYWMESTGQQDQVADELGPQLRDIEAMQEIAARVRATRVLESKLAQAARRLQVRREAARAEREQRLADEHAEELLDELLSEAVARDELEAMILAEARTHERSKRRGLTVSLDSGVGGAINASVDEVVRAFDARGVLGDQRG